ncbi:MAG: formyltransferase family protein [Planctomycetota bacterium]
MRDWRGDWIVSFKSDLYLPQVVLGHARLGAINFHPAPPRYRGLGGYSLALHNSDTTFGVTCHHMDETLDHGPIIAVREFPILPCRTVAALRAQTAIECLHLLHEVVTLIAMAHPLPVSTAAWSDHLFTIAEVKQIVDQHV